VLEIHREVTLTTNSFPAFSGLLASLTAAAAAAPEEIPTYKKNVIISGQGMPYG